MRKKAGCDWPADDKGNIVPRLAVQAKIEQLVAEATPAESVFLGMATTVAPHPIALPDSKKGIDARILDIEPSIENPLQFEEASVGGFLDFLYPIYVAN